MSVKPNESVQPRAANAASQIALNAAPAAAARVTAPARPRVLIEPEEAGVRLDLPDLWDYRELLLFFIWRDVKVRYKQTLMGAAWVIIQPLCTMLIVAFVFQRLGGLPAEQMPYPLFAYAGLLLWTFFSNAISNCTLSLVQNNSLITKVYFPRLFVPAAAVIAGLVDFSIAALILVGMCVHYHVALTWHVLLLPVFVAHLTLFALGVGFLVSALTVKYRDLRHVMPFVLQFWFFASPVIYPASSLGGRWYWLFAVNPVSGIVEGFRAALTGRALPLGAVALSAALTVLLFVCAVYVFRRLEAGFADVL